MRTILKIYGCSEKDLYAHYSEAPGIFSSKNYDFIGNVLCEAKLPFGFHKLFFNIVSQVYFLIPVLSFPTQYILHTSSFGHGCCALKNVPCLESNRVVPLFKLFMSELLVGSYECASVHLSSTVAVS